jgi:hypothetical protein
LNCKGTIATDSFDELIHRVGISFVVDDHSGFILSESQSSRFADAFGRAGDENHGLKRVAHVLLVDRMIASSL